MIKQVTMERAFELESNGKEVKVLIPGCVNSVWEEMQPSTLRSILDGVLFFEDFEETAKTAPGGIEEPTRTTDKPTDIPTAMSETCDRSECQLPENLICEAQPEETPGTEKMPSFEDELLPFEPEEGETITDPEPEEAKKEPAAEPEAKETEEPETRIVDGVKYTKVSASTYNPVQPGARMGESDNGDVPGNSGRASDRSERVFHTAEESQVVEETKKEPEKAKPKMKVTLKVEEEKHNKAVTLRRAGWSIKGIANEFGCAENTIRAWLRAKGMK